MSSSLLLIASMALILLAGGLLLLATARARSRREAASLFVQARTENVRARYAKPADHAIAAANASGNFVKAWRDRLRRAGMEPTRKTVIVWCAPSVILVLLAAARGGWLAAVAMTLICLAGVAFLFWRRTDRFHRQLCQQLPGFLDGVVRMMSIGSAVPAAFQNAIPNTAQPLRDCLANVIHMQRAGTDLDQAVLHIGRVYRVNELLMLSSVLRLSLRYGGRADVVMERTAAFMRDREQAERELIALSAETRLSAWILGILPFAMVGMMFMMNAAYILTMWRDPTGRSLLIGAAVLELFGALMLFRLARAV